jgi:hypothetical protein
MAIIKRNEHNGYINVHNAKIGLLLFGVYQAFQLAQVVLPII